MPAGQGGICQRGRAPIWRTATIATGSQTRGVYTTSSSDGLLHNQLEDIAMNRQITEGQFTQSRIKAMGQASLSQAQVGEMARSKKRRQSKEGGNLFSEPALIRLLVDQARRRGELLTEMSKHLGVTYGYIAQLRTGHRLTIHISDGFANSCARYLNVPPVLVKLIAGRIMPADFAWPQEARQSRVDATTKKMLTDARFASSVPPGFLGCDESVQEFVCMLYDELNTSFDERLKTLPKALRALQRAVEAVGEFDKKVRPNHRNRDADGDMAD